MNERNSCGEEIRVTGSQLVNKVKELLHEGNVRRLHIKHQGRTIMELPLNVVAVGVIVAPMLAALAVFAALVTECTVVVERDQSPSETTEV